MASVAADTSAIAPPLPLPSRSDAAPPAGPSGAFADLLNAQAAAPKRGTASPSSTAPAGTQDGSNPNPPGAAGSDPAVASATPANPAPPKGSSGKDAGNGKDPKENGDAATDNSGNSGSPGAATVITILATLPLPVAPIALASDANPPTPSDAQGARANPVAPVNTDSAGKSSDVGGASAASNPVAAERASLVPDVPSIISASAPARAPSAVTGNATDGSPSATLPATVRDTAIASALTSSAGLDAPPAATVPSQANGTAPPDATAAAPSPDAVLGSAAAAELQTATIPALSAMAEAPGVPDQNAKTNPPVPPASTPAASAGTLSPMAGVPALNPLLLATAGRSAVQAGEQTFEHPGSTRESDPTSMALPAQVARFAASIRATDEATSDANSDGLLVSASGTDATTRSGNDQPNPTQPNFNPAVLTTVQAAAIVAAPPPHMALATDLVPLAGIPIAIAARVEAGEKHFEIRLDPPDLGRIEVQLSVDSSGRATSHLVVDRADTLDLLQRDAPSLERALHSAGLTTGDGALQFSLRDQSFAGRDQSTPAPLPPVSTAGAAENDVAPIDAALRRYGPPTGLGSGVDIRV